MHGGFLLLGTASVGTLASAPGKPGPERLPDDRRGVDQPYRARQSVLHGPQTDPENRRAHRAAGDPDFPDRMPVDVTAVGVVTEMKDRIEFAESAGDG